METNKVVGKMVLEKTSCFITLDRLVENSGLDRIAVRKVMDKFCRDGFIKIIKVNLPVEPTFKKGHPAMRITYRLINKKGLQSHIAPKLKEGTSLDRIWTVIHHKRHFTTEEIVRLAEVERENARWFCKMLRRAGYIAPSRLGGPGVEWRLIKDPGPRRPYVGDQKPDHLRQEAMAGKQSA